MQDANVLSKDHKYKDPYRHNLTTLDAPKDFEEEKRDTVFNSLMGGIEPIAPPSSREGTTEMGSFLSNDQFSALKGDGVSTRRDPKSRRMSMASNDSFSPVRVGKKS